MKDIIDEDFALYQNYSNPFNPSTTISFTLPQAGNVELTLFDAVGREIEEITNKEFSVGTHSINYNAGNLSSGVYFYRITAGTFTQVNKMMLLK